jgi:glutamine---fructose-6-phosphate transaminase (isomerizing)
MNLTDPKYKDFALVQEMLETPEIIGKFDFDLGIDASAALADCEKCLLTGEGSSRIFPAKNLMYQQMACTGSKFSIMTDGARQAHEYNLDNTVVLGLSNSGQTKEVISLFTKLAEAGHQMRFGLTANENTKLDSVSNECCVLSCGKENAVAATKSVVEQAMFYLGVLLNSQGDIDNFPIEANQNAAAAAAKEVLETELDPELVKMIADAPMIYFAGRNDGVAEELTLKTNEITRKKSDFLEGTYAVHGIEEVMNPEEVVIVVEPFTEEIEKFQQTLVEGIGMKVIAISSEETPLPTIKIPKVAGYDSILQLLAGWNILVSVGIACGVDLDKPQRARKIGNEFEG